MKNLKYIIPIFLLMLCVILFVIYNETTCSLENCDNTRVNGGKYCSEHTCETEGCVNKKHQVLISVILAMRIHLTTKTIIKLP